MSVAAGDLIKVGPFGLQARRNSDGSSTLLWDKGGVDTAGNGLPENFDNLPQTLTYNADGTLNTVSKTYGGHTWTQTFGYTSGNVTSISGWVKS